MSKFALLDCSDWCEVREDQQFEKVSRMARNKLQGLMDALSDIENHEAFEPIDLSICHTPEGDVCDIFMRGGSIGYYAVRTLCTAFDVPFSSLIEVSDDIPPYGEGKYAIPLMGPAE